MIEDAFTTQLAEVSRATLAPVIRCALNSENAELVDWRYSRVTGGLGMDSTVVRFSGHARVQDDTVPWSCILKRFPSLVASEFPSGFYYAKREPLAYQSGFLSNLPGRVTAPRCFGMSEDPDDGCWLWLEEITDESAPVWSLQDYYQVARQLGAFNGAYLTSVPIPCQPWLSTSNLRGWIAEGAAGIERLPSVLHDPLVRAVYPEEVTAGILRWWAERDRYLDALDCLPTTFCHHDAFRRNLFIRRNGQGHNALVAIDWTDAGTGPISQEIGPLVAASLGFFAVDLEDAEDLDQLVFEGYLAGLDDAGWHGDPRVMRFGYAAASALRYGVGVTSRILQFLLEEPVLLAQTMQRPLAEVVDRWAGCLRFQLKLAEEARALLDMG